MRGFQPKNKRNQEAEQPQPGLGMIRGKGTGTSDSIKAQVPTGSYIMPADSTEQIGGENLAGLGFKPRNVPVNVSNGEFGLSPEQVHAVGVQALDQMKDATHTPVAKGFSPQREDALFFADGGLVDPNDPRYKQQMTLRNNQQMALRNNQQMATRQALATTNPVQPNTMRTVTPIHNPPATQQTINPNQPANAAANAAQPAAGNSAGRMAGAMDKARGFANNSKLVKGGVYLGAASSLLANADTGSDQYRERFGFGDQAPEELGTAKGFAKDFGIRTLGYASDLGNALTFGQAGRFYRDKQRIAAEGNTAKPAPAEQPAAQSTAQPDTASRPNTMPATQPAQQSPAQPLANNITRNGNNFSGNNISPGFTINGQPYNGSTLNPQANSTQNQQAVQALLDRTPELGRGFSPAAYEQSMTNAGQQAAAINAGQQLQARRYEDRQRIENDLRMAQSERVAGANGMTKAQRDQIAGLQAQLMGISGQEYDQAKNDTNNNAALQKQMLGDQAALQRTAIQEAGATGRNTANNNTDLAKFGANYDLENRKFASDQQIRGFDIAKLQRVQNLYDQYDAAKTPAERSAIAKTLQELSGNGQGNRYTVVPGGQEWDNEAQATLNRPSMVLDNQTGQFVQQGQQQASFDNSAVDTSGYQKGEIFQDKTTGKSYKWDGSKMVPVG